MAKCLDCGQVYSVYGGGRGSKCPTCKSSNTSAKGECIIQISNKSRVEIGSECNSQNKELSKRG